MKVLSLQKKCRMLLRIGASTKRKERRSVVISAT
jgi:hypothetical protein